MVSIFKKILFALIILLLLPVASMAGSLIDLSDQVAGEDKEVIQTANLRNITFQFKLIAGTGNTLGIQFLATVYSDANNDTNDDWEDITELLSDSPDPVTVTEGVLRGMYVMDTNCAFAKVKVVYVVTAATPDNTIKVGWHSDK